MKVEISPILSSVLINSNCSGNVLHCFFGLLAVAVISDIVAVRCKTFGLIFLIKTFQKLQIKEYFKNKTSLGKNIIIVAKSLNKINVLVILPQFG